jgi:transglutaminase-like putative cysteine protease
VFLIEAPSREVTAEISIGSKQPKKLYEIEKWLYQMQINLSIIPGATTTEWIDSAGKTWISTTKLGPFTIELRTVPKHEALRPPQDTDIMLGAGVQPDRRITNPRDVKELLIYIENKDSDDNDLPQLPESHYQTVTRKKNALYVTLSTPDHDDHQAAYTPPYSDDTWNSYLQPTPWLETESQLLKKMAHSIPTDNQTPIEIAHTIEKFVHDEIEDKNFGMGFATALETAQQKAGDCTEHALLAAALLRTKGIPSRVVTGLAYGGPFAGQNVPKFYFHMWVEAWTGEWTPIDPALGGYDATHIALTRSDLSSHGDLMDISNAVGKFATHNRIYIKGYR